MKVACTLCVFLLCAVLSPIASTPVKESEEKLAKRHDLSNDKALLLQKIRDLEIEVGGRRSSEVPDDNQDPVSVDPRKKEGPVGRQRNVLASLLRRGSSKKAVQYPEDPYEATLKRLLDEEFESGKFVDQPFTNDRQGQSPNEEIADDVADEEEDGNGNEGGAGGGTVDSDQGEPNDLLHDISVDDISVDDLKDLINEIRQKKRDEETEDNNELTDEELNEAIEGLVAGVSTDDLQRMLAAVRARKQGLNPQPSEEKVILALIEFLSGLTTEDLRNAILAIKRMKLEMEQAEDLAAEYTDEDFSDYDDDYSYYKDISWVEKQGADNDIPDDSGPCAQEKQDILDEMEAARLAGNHHVGGELPNCNEDGYYAPKQCSGTLCYCVDIHGRATKGEAMIWDAASLKCSQDEVETATDGSSVDDANENETDEEDEEDEDEDEEEAQLEQVERHLLDMLQQQKRHQLAKKDQLNM